MSDLRVLFLDIDGTIAGIDNDVRPAVRSAVRAAKAKGIQVAIATGRMYRSALRFAAAIDADLPLIAYNGAWIRDLTSDRVYWHRPVPEQLAARLLDDFEQPEWHSQLSVHFYIDDRLHVRHVTPETASYAERSDIEPVVVEDLRSTLKCEPTKILALSSESAVISQLLARLQQRYPPTELYLTQSVATFFEACHPQVSKGRAVRHLTEQILQLRPENVLAIGDNFNDMEMLAYAGVSVAMGSAPDRVQQIADWVAPDVEQDGVAAAIEKFLL